MRRLLLLGVFYSACGGSSSAAPSGPSTPTPPAPITITLSGSVRATNGGQPLGGLQAALGSSMTIATDGAGTFTAQMQPTSSLSLALTGSGIVPRSLYVAAGSSRSVTLDAIALAGFDLNFYRQLVRNSYEGPLEPIRRWTRHMNVFLQTANVSAASMDIVEQVVRDAVPRWTAGRVNVETVERGAATREGQAGWLTVKWNAENTGHCGIGDIGREGGMIELQYGTPGCSCNGWAIRPSTVRHEIGHAMGFWHTDTPADLMFPSNGVCDKPISSRELAAAAIAYQRPVGNVDPDQDPSGVVTLAPMRIH